MLPRAVRLSKKTFRLQLSGQCLMTSKLLAVVKRQRQHLFLVLAQRLDNQSPW